MAVAQRIIVPCLTPTCSFCQTKTKLNNPAFRTGQLVLRQQISPFSASVMFSFYISPTALTLTSTSNAIFFSNYCASSNHPLVMFLGIFWSSWPFFIFQIKLTSYKKSTLIFFFLLLNFIWWQFFKGFCHLFYILISLFFYSTKLNARSLVQVSPSYSTFLF